MKIWTATTDGDNRPTTTTVHGSREEAEARVNGDLDGHAYHTEAVRSGRRGPRAWLDGEHLRGEWENVCDGCCIIEEHDAPKTIVDVLEAATAVLNGLNRRVASGDLAAGFEGVAALSGALVRAGVECK